MTRQFGGGVEMEWPAEGVIATLRLNKERLAG
jgi:hypothetical protein